MSYIHITPFERSRIEVLHKEGYCTREIGRQLSRSASTISRELKRCKPGEYKAEVAHQDYLEKRKRVPCKGKASPELVATIREKLEPSWSPDQIVGRLIRGKPASKRSIAGSTKVS